MKKGEKIQKELSAEQLGLVKKQLQEGKKTLPNTAVVRKSLEGSLNLDNHILRAVVNYDVEVADSNTSRPSENPQPTPGDNGNTTPTPGDNGNTNPQPGDNGNTNPQPGDNGNTNPQPGDNGNTNPQPGDNGNTNPTPGDNGNTTPTPGDNGNTTPTPGDNGNTTPQPGDNQPTEDKELKELKVKANEKVKYSEKIADKKPYYDKIATATTKEEVEKIINEVEALNNNVTPPTPTVEKTLEEVKAELTKLVSENLKETEKYKKLPKELQTAYNKAFARAQYLLDNSTSKEDIAKQVELLSKATADVKNYKEVTPTPTPGDNGNTTPTPGDNGNVNPQPGDNGNTNVQPTPGDKELEALKTELKNLASRNIRDEKGYVPNNGNQTDNNNWIAAKTNAEAVLKNDKATKEDFEKAINELSEKTYMALLGSEKTKVRTALANSSLELAEKGPLKAKINKAKTFKELDEIAKKVGVEVKVPTLPPKYKDEQGNSGNVEPTPQPGDNGNTTPTPGDNGNTNPTPGDNGNTNPTPGDNGNTNPTPGDNGNTTPTPTPGDNTTSTEVTAVKEGIKRGNIEGKGGSLLLDVVGKNLDPKKVTINAYVNGKKAENVIFENFLGATKELITFNVKISKNDTNSELTYKFVAVVDGKETGKFYEKVQDTFVETAKITNYENKKTTLSADGGVASLLLKGSGLNDKNVKVRIFDADEVEENAELTKKVVYTKQGNDILVSVELPKNTTASSKSYKLKLYANDKEVNITTLDGRDRRDKPVFTVVGSNQDASKPILSNVTITSYKTSGTGAVSDGVEKTETTVALNQVSKKTEVHLYGANLDATKTRVRITDQNGVEWPIGGAESELIKMVLKNDKGMKGIQGNGTFQIAEIILPSNLSENMTFTYTFAVDGVNFDTAHQVRAHVEKTGGQVNPTVRKVTLKYQTADGKEVAKDKVVDVYSHFPVSSGVTAIDGYTFEKVKDLAADSNFGDKNEVVYIYKEKSATPQPGNNGTVTPTPGENEKPTPGTGNNSEKEEVAKLKADLKILADRDLTKEANYKMAGEPQETAWKTNVKKANELLAKTNATKEELASRIEKLTKAIKALEDANKEKNKEETPAPTPGDNNTEKPGDNGTENPTPEKPSYEKEIAAGRAVLSEDKTKITFSDNDGDTPVKVTIAVDGLPKDVARLEVSKAKADGIEVGKGEVYDIHFVTENGENRPINKNATVEIPVEKEVDAAFHVSGDVREPLEFKNIEKDGHKYVEVTATHFSLVGIEYKEETPGKVETAVFEEIPVINDKYQVKEHLTFTATNTENPKDVRKLEVSESLLQNGELALGAEYILTLDENEYYTFKPITVTIEKVEDEYLVLFNAETGEAVASLNLVKKEKTQPTPSPEVTSLDNVVIKSLTKDGKALGDVPFRLFEYDGAIPNILLQPNTDKEGKLTISTTTLKKNHEYELRVNKRDTSFVRQSLRFTTDENGKINTLDGKEVNKDTSNTIEFRVEKDNDQEVKKVTSYFKVVDEKGNPVEGVELSASGIANKITTLKNAKSNKDGIVALELESKVNGENYVINVSKNDQFNWDFLPDAVSIFVENGELNYTDKEGKYKTFNYNNVEIPVFVVTKHDQNQLKVDLAAKIKEAEEVLKTNNNKELSDIVASAKAELAKPETLPIYVKGYLDNLNNQLSKMKEAEKPAAKKVALDDMIVSKDGRAVTDEVAFEFVPKTGEAVTFTAPNGILSGVELTVGETYTVRVKENAKYSYEKELEVKEIPNFDMYGLFEKGSEEPLVELKLADKETKPSTETRKKGKVIYIAVSDENGPTSKPHFTFTNKKDPKDTFTLKPKDGILKNFEVYLEEEYLVSIVEKDKYNFPDMTVVAHEIDGEVDMYLPGEDGDYIEAFDITTKKETKPVEPVEEEDDPAYRKTLDVRVLRDGQPVANAEFGVLKFAEDNSSREIKTVKTDEKGMISIKVLEELPKDGVFTLYSKENSKKFIAFYSDNEGWLWNVNGSEFNEKTPKVFELVLDSKKPAVDEKLEAKKKEARQVVTYSEKIHDKTPYMNRIKAATSVEVLDALIAEVNALNNNSSAERPGEDENTTSEVTTYKANKEVVDKGDGKIEVTFEGTKIDVNKLSYTVKKGVSKLGSNDYAVKVVSKEANKVVVEFTLSEAVRSNSDQYKILAKYNNETIRSAAVAFTMK